MSLPLDQMGSDAHGDGTVRHLNGAHTHSVYRRQLPSCGTRFAVPTSLARRPFALTPCRRLLLSPLGRGMERHAPRQPRK